MPAWVECPSPATKNRKIQYNDLFQMYWQSILTITLTALTLLSCSSSKQDDPFIPEPNDNVGIAFGGNNGTWQDAPTTRATGTGLETLFPTFRVWGYKTTSTTAAAPSAPETVMDGYIVRHYSGTAGSTESNTTGWEYAGIQNTALSSIQTIKYWDYSATSYRFFAYSPSDTQAVSAQASDSKSFSFSFPFAYSDATTATTLPYISELWFALPASSGSVSTPASSYGSCVTLTFAPLIAKVRFKLSRRGRCRSNKRHTVSRQPLLGRPHYRNDTSTRHHHRHLPTAGHTNKQQSHLIVDHDRYSGRQRCFIHRSTHPHHTIRRGRRPDTQRKRQESLRQVVLCATFQCHPI